MVIQVLLVLCRIHLPFCSLQIRNANANASVNVDIVIQIAYKTLFPIRNPITIYNPLLSSHIPTIESYNEATTPFVLQLELQQITHHLARGNARSRPQSREVESAGKGIGVAEEQHGRDPATRVLECEARAIHLVLLDLAADQVVHGTGGVLLGFEGSGDVGKLLAVQDVEVVVCGVAAGVALGADGGT